MLNKKKIQSELYFSNSLRGLVSAYQEISAIRMRKVKKSVIDAREYLSDLTELYRESLSFYTNYTQHKAHHFFEKPQPEVTSKSLLILITANTGLYGSVMRETFDLFMQDLQKPELKSSEILLLGRLGKKWLDDAQTGRAYKYIEINDYGKNELALQKLLASIITYSNVAVYHGFFESVSSQKPVRTLLSGSDNVFNSSSADNEKSFEHCIYEPSIETVISFFEDQILAVLFEQTLFESDLGKYASRMVNLEKAYSNINDYVYKLKLLNRKIRTKEINSQQQSLLATVLS